MNTSPIPTPRYRHATPSGPWPFLDSLDEVPKEDIHPRPENGKCKDGREVLMCDDCLDNYPQSLFPNWTDSQQRKSNIYKNKQLEHACSLRPVEMSIDEAGAPFKALDVIHVDNGNDQSAREELRGMRRRPVKVRTIFVDGISGPALKMLGTIFDIEPFFWSSSFGWTPSRFQESLDQEKKSDHITVILRFVRKVPRAQDSEHVGQQRDANPERLMIDVNKPLILGQHLLQPDLLALHMVRSKEDSTIISYHCSQAYGSTSSEELCNRLQLVGQSVYWTKLFQANPDPTFVLVSMLWYALYAWDEAIQELYSEISKLEALVMKTLELTNLTNHLHAISAHLLHYITLLADFRKAVKFVRNTPNPAVDDSSSEMKAALDNECDHLLREIVRIEKDCKMQNMRLENVMNLGYSRLNIDDSKQMTHLTKVSVQDSKAMKQVSFLTMIFLPASFMANIFSMNVREINPTAGNSNLDLRHFFAAAITLTLVTIWAVGAMQLPYIARNKDALTRVDGQETRNPYKWSRLWWPVILIKTSLTDQPENRKLRGLEYE